MADGTEYDLPAVNLPASGIATIDVKTALASTPAALASHISDYGSATLRYNGLESALLGQTALGSTALSESFLSHFTAVMPGSPATQTLEGLWWARDAGIGGFVGLGNATAQLRTVIVEALTASGQVQATQSFTLAPHASQMIDLFPLIGPPKAGDAGGLRIQFDGLLGEINVTGGIENRQEGYSAVIPFWQAPMAGMNMPASIATIAHPGIMVGAADPMMGFPAGTRFLPYLALRNLTGSVEQVNLTLYTEQGTALTASPQSLQPFEARQVDMNNVLQQLGLKNFHGAVTLTVGHSGGTSDVMSAAGSVDVKGTYVFEVAGRAAEQMLSKQSPYWSVKNGNDTMVALWNPSASAEDVMVTLKYASNSGRYHFRIHLAPHATANVDLKELIANQSRDEDGNMLPVDLQEGSFVFHNAKEGHAPLSVNVNVGIFNVVKGTCYVSGIYCDGYEYSLILSPATFSLASDGGAEMVSAYGQYSDGTTRLVGASFSSSDTSVVTVDGPLYGQYVTAVKAGQAQITATANLPVAGNYYGYNPCCSNLQSYSNYTGTATATVSDTTPVITGIQPSDWQALSTTTVTITGQSFGTNPPTLSFSPNPGISYTLSSYNNTQIVANMNVSADWAGVVNLAVTSNGYNGQGFAGNGNGQSPQSAPSNVGIYQVFNYSEVTVIAWVDGNAPDLVTLPSGANPSLIFDLNHPSLCAADVAAWALNKKPDLQSSADYAYANAFLLKNSANPQPPLTITPSAFLQTGSFRLFNDYGAPKSSTSQVGPTPNPCGFYIPDWLRASQPSPYNGATACGTPSNQCYQLAEGRLGTKGQKVNQNLNGRSTPWIWSVIEFNSAGTPTYTDHAIFPTYWVYVNGILTATYPQSSAATFMANDDSYQRTPSQVQ